MSDYATEANWNGISLRYLSLITLTFQNSALVLIMRYSRVMPSLEGPYFTSTAVLLSELIKFTICSVVVFYDARQKGVYDVEAIWRICFGADSLKLAIPAALYSMQNNLQYIAVSNLDAATFQVTYQLKILTSAIFSVTMLRKNITTRQWLALFLLTFGIALVQIPSSSINAFNVSNVHSTILTPMSYQAQYGLTAVILACLLSGLAGVYFEKVLKASETTLWVRNVQLSFFSLFPALILGVIWKDGTEIWDKGFFYGYNSSVILAITFQASGGIIVAVCVAYADNVMKNFATSISIIISFVASVYLFQMAITVNFIMGSVLVVYATFLYSNSSRKHIPLADLDKTAEKGAFPGSAARSAYQERDLEA